MIEWTDLYLDTDDLDTEHLLSEWGWLLDRPYQPVGRTAFGDFFLMDDDGSVHMLDLVAGRLHTLAGSMEQFQADMQKPENVEQWFMASLVNAMMDRGVAPGAGQCYGFKVAPVLGGKLEADNVEVMDLDVYVPAVAQVHRNVVELPPGGSVEEITPPAPAVS